MAITSITDTLTATTHCQAAVFLEKDVTSKEVMTTYTDKGWKSFFSSWEALIPDLSQLTALNHLAMNLVTLVVLGMFSIGISCALTVFILKSIREYGTMKTMGVTAGETFFINWEVLLLNGAASTIGMGGGALMVYLFGKTKIDPASYTSHTPFFTVSGVIYPRLSTMVLSFPYAFRHAFFFGAGHYRPPQKNRRNHEDHITTMLNVEHLSKSYVSGKRTVNALSDISFQAGPGTPLTLTGKSGSGKTTLLNCLGGLEKPDHGRITLLGHDITALNSDRPSGLPGKALISRIFTLAATDGVLLVIFTHDPEIIRISPKAIVLFDGRIHKGDMG